MQRRQFLRLSAFTSVAVIIPASNAEDFRATRPTVWTAHNVDDAITALYGTKEAIQSGVTITTPEVATNGAAVPVNIKSDIDAVSVAVFQDANPEATVAVFTIHENSIIDYNLNMKLRSDGTPITITAIVQGRDGKLYSDLRTLSVPLGTCDG